MSEAPLHGVAGAEYRVNDPNAAETSGGCINFHVSPWNFVFLRW